MSSSTSSSRSTTTTSSSGSGAEVNFFGVDGAAEHAFPLYTLPDAVRLKNHVLERWEEADRKPELVEDGALNVVVVGGGPTGVETAGAMAELYNGVFKKDYPDVPRGSGDDHARRGRPRDLPDVQARHPRLHGRGAREARGRGADRRRGRVDHARPGSSSSRETSSQAHTLVWGAGLQGNELVRSLGLELERGNRIAVDEELRIPAHPEVYAVGDVAAITDAKTEQVLPQLGSVALQSGEHAGETIATRDRRQGDEAVQVPRQGHDGRRSGGARPSCRCWAARR